MQAAEVKRLAQECGFELAGIASAEPSPDFGRYIAWIERGMAGSMGYLTDRRANIRSDPKLLLPSARSVICVGKLYNSSPHCPDGFTDSGMGRISRYAWGEDYHDVMRTGLEKLAAKLGPDHEWKVCIDTAPLLERSYARAAGLGWIGKNTCLINQEQGSWFFLGELLTSLTVEPDQPPPDRCGTCTRCVEACPTQAIAADGYELDARACISYLTIELRGPIPNQYREQIGNHVFGCDICQDVCPWNQRAPITEDPALAGHFVSASLEKMAELAEPEFREIFRHSPIRRAKYTGFLRNVAIAIGNNGLGEFRQRLEALAQSPNELVSEAATWALDRLNRPEPANLSS